jgi:hypothetical protein
MKGLLTMNRRTSIIVGIALAAILAAFALPVMLTAGLIVSAPAFLAALAWTLGLGMALSFIVLTTHMLMASSDSA